VQLPSNRNQLLRNAKIVDMVFHHMKTKYLNLIIVVAALFLSPTLTIAQADSENPEDEPQSVQSIAVDPAVVVIVCLESGNIFVKGGERRELRVKADETARVTLVSGEGTRSSTPATRVEVMVTNQDNPEAKAVGECHGSSDLDLEVPRGATIYVKTRDGDIDISDVAEVKAESLSGNIGMMRIARAAEASTVNGDVSLEQSNGRIRLRSISGNLEAFNAKSVEQNDSLFAKTISGDVTLDNVAQQRVEAGTISGDVMLTGPLAPDGFYDFKTTNGDVTLNLPVTVSFHVTARVSQGGEVVTEFPLKYAAGMPTKDVVAPGKLTGSYGNGTAPATINLVSFSGSLRLHKQ
jgi:Putative adhesin